MELPTIHKISPFPLFAKEGKGGNGPLDYAKSPKLILEESSGERMPQAIFSIV